MKHQGVMFKKEKKRIDESDDEEGDDQTQIIKKGGFVSPQQPVIQYQNEGQGQNRTVTSNPLQLSQQQQNQFGQQQLPPSQPNVAAAATKPPPHNPFRKNPFANGPQQLQTQQQQNQFQQPQQQQNLFEQPSKQQNQFQQPQQQQNQFEQPQKQQNQFQQPQQQQFQDIAESFIQEKQDFTQNYHQNKFPNSKNFNQQNAPINQYKPQNETNIDLNLAQAKYEEEMRQKKLSPRDQPQPPQQPQPPHHSQSQQLWQQPKVSQSYQGKSVLLKNTYPAPTDYSKNPIKGAAISAIENSHIETVTQASIQSSIGLYPNIDSNSVYHGQLIQPHFLQFKANQDLCQILVAENASLGLALTRFFVQKALFDTGVKVKDAYNNFTQTNAQLLKFSTNGQVIDFKGIAQKIANLDDKQEMKFQNIYVDRTFNQQLSALSQIIKSKGLNMGENTYDLLSDSSKLFYAYIINTEKNPLQLPIQNEDYFFLATRQSSKDFLPVFFNAVNSSSKTSYLVKQVPQEFRRIDSQVLEDFSNRFATNEELQLRLQFKPLLSTYDSIENLTTENYFEDMVQEYSKGQTSDFFKMIKKGVCAKSIFNKTTEDSLLNMLEIHKTIVWMKKVERKVTVFQNFTRARTNLPNSNSYEGQLNRKLVLLYKNFVKELEQISLIEQKLGYQFHPLSPQVQIAVKGINSQRGEPVKKIMGEIYTQGTPTDYNEILSAGNVVLRVSDNNFVFFYQPKSQREYSTYAKVAGIFNEQDQKILRQSAEPIRIPPNSDFNIELKQKVEDKHQYIINITDKNYLLGSYTQLKVSFESIIVNKLIELVERSQEKIREIDLQQIISRS